MRLKGGKVLLDLTGYELVNGIEHYLSEEETKAICEKGLIIQLKIDNVKVTFEPLLKSAEDGVGIEYYSIFEGDDEYIVHITFDVVVGNTLNIYKNT